MKKARFLSLALLIPVFLTLGSCSQSGDDDEGNGDGLCNPYCAELESMDCLNGETVDDCEASCEAEIGESSCGGAYESVVQCSLDNTMACVDGSVEVLGCDDEDAFWIDCNGGVCAMYCAEVDSIGCLDDSTISECEDICDAIIDEEDCGPEFEAYYNCAVHKLMECTDGSVEVSGCDDEEDDVIDCIYDM